jgi:hypothetical protein
MGGGVKLALIAIGALIAFFLVGTVVHLVISALITVAIAAAIVGGIVIAIKVARSNRQVTRGHRDSELRDTSPRRLPRVDLDEYTGPRTSAAPRPAANPSDVEDELTRLKREMGA